ncbi:hypothetical protein JK621_09900 [Serratia plymuthica]|uniref:hypothetical protein n=1 Tax=Serratia plymuthica TaxID=82996 RepID=UPI001BB07998|nr:hypothetical protein [Serratia plymuthica]QUY50430.1 hypothetical protein JK621_09900 [Serratia plymuthica]
MPQFLTKFLLENNIEVSFSLKSTKSPRLLLLGITFLIKNRAMAGEVAHAGERVQNVISATRRSVKKPCSRRINGANGFHGQCLFVCQAQEQWGVHQETSGQDYARQVSFESLSRGGSGSEPISVMACPPSGCAAKRGPSNAATPGIDFWL